MYGLCGDTMEIGTIVKSKKGHDTGRIYLVTAILNENFALICNGKQRKLDNPKQKRVKHLEVIAKVEIPSDLNDAKLRKICKL